MKDAIDSGRRTLMPATATHGCHARVFAVVRVGVSR